MTTTREGTWREAKKDALVQAKDLTIWRLVSMGRDETGQIVVTMAEIDPVVFADDLRTIQVRPTSYDDPIRFVEPLIEPEPPALSKPGQALAEKLAAATQRAHDAIAAANARRDVGTYGQPANEPVDVQPANVGEPETEIPYAEPMDLEPAPYVEVVTYPGYAEPESDSALENAVQVTATIPAETVDPAPIQALGEVWPVGPLDDATAGEMMTHLFLFHGEWAKEIPKKGKALLTELHRLHGEKEHGTSQSAGIHHEHRAKGNQAP